MRNAMLAVALAQRGHVGGETVLEGPAGFYHAYAGNNTAAHLQLRRRHPARASTSITAGSGQGAGCSSRRCTASTRSAGYNIAHVDVTAQLCEEHDISYQDVDRVEAVVNWLETQYPSPAFPTQREDRTPQARAARAYYTAYGVVKRGFPMLALGAANAGADDPPEVLELMKRVTIIPSHKMTLFGPRITIFTKDGKSYTKQADRPRVHLGLRRGGAPHSRRHARPADPGGAVRGNHRDVPRPRSGATRRHACETDAKNSGHLTNSICHRSTAGNHAEHAVD